MDSLASKTLIMIVGPTGIGKSTLMNQLCALDPSFRRVRSFTTRQPRENDEENQYIYLTSEQLDNHLGTGDVITDVTFPGTDIHYGTLTESYPSDFNLLDTLASSVSTYRSLPFYQTITVSLTTDPAAWASWLSTRLPEHDENRTKRLEEARQSVNWSLTQTDNHYWLTNTPGDIATPVQQLLQIVKGQGQNFTTPPESATAMLDTIDSLLSLG